MGCQKIICHACMIPSQPLIIIDKPPTLLGSLPEFDSSRIFRTPKTMIIKKNQITDCIFPRLNSKSDSPEPG